MADHREFLKGSNKHVTGPTMSQNTERDNRHGSLNE